jgi:hypothetical protein
MKHYIILTLMLVGGAAYATLVNGDAIVIQDVITLARMSFGWLWRACVVALVVTLTFLMVYNNKEEK